MSRAPLQLAIVYPGDSEVRRLATPRNNRFAALFEAFAAHGVQAHPAVYDPAQIDALRDQLLGLDGALVWVNPIEAGQPRDRLDAMLREVAAAGVCVSTHPDVILKLGTKDVLVDTRAMGWGSDVFRLDSLAGLRTELGVRLGGGRDARAQAVARPQRHRCLARRACARAGRVRAAEPCARAPCAARQRRNRAELRGLVDLMAPYFE